MTILAVLYVCVVCVCSVGKYIQADFGQSPV